MLYSSKHGINYAIITSIYDSLANVISVLGHIVVLYYGGIEVFKGTMTIGTLISLNSLVSLLYSPIERIINFNRLLQVFKIEFDKLNKFMKDNVSNTNPKLLIIDEGTCNTDSDSENRIIENILGWAVLGIIRTTVESLPLIILVIIISYKSLTLMNISIVLGIFLMSIIASFGMTFFIFGLTLIIKEGDQLASFIGNSAPFLGGLYFPIMLLPSPLRYISFIFPFTWGVDILRGTLLNINTIFSIRHEFIILVILSIGYLIIGKVAYYMLEKKARNVGVQGF